MRVLIVAPEAPLPPVNGLRLPLGELVAGLRERHDVRVVAMLAADQQRPDAAVPGLVIAERPHGGMLATASDALRFAAGRPWRADRVAADLRAPLAGQLAEFDPDVIHVFSGRLAALGRALAGRPSVLSALDARHRNVEAEARTARGVRRRLLHRNARNVEAFAAAEYARFGRVVSVTPQDREAILAVAPGASVSVIPNGVDTGSFSRSRPEGGPGASRSHPQHGPGASRSHPQHGPGARIVFHGVLRYAPNVVAAEYAAREVLPRVRTRRPDAELVLVGRAPHPRVVALGAADGVTVTGEVGDVAEWLSAAAVYLCPMQTGTGIKNKLLEAFAAGAPAVATPLAIQGLDVVDGTHLLLGETAEQLAAAVLRLLDDSGLAARLGEAGRRYVARAHTWAAVVEAYERVYAEVAAEPS